MAGRAKVPAAPARRTTALRWGLVAGVLLWALGNAGRVAAAQDPAAGGSLPKGTLGTGAVPDFSRPYGAIEFGIGILALPDAEVCAGEVGCDRGDVSLEVDAWPLFRASPSWAVGAGMTLALTPTQDAPQQNMRFPREHTRRYFLVEGIGRYYFVHGRVLEAWSGISTGLVVVSDNFRTTGTGSEMTIIGADNANIATEGLTLGGAAGVTFGVNQVLQLGATLRVANWFLPSTRERIAFGEAASLSDRVTMIHFAFTVAYHGH